MIKRHKGNGEKLYGVASLHVVFVSLGLVYSKSQYWFLVCGEGVRPVMMGTLRENLILFVANSYI
jgi:hypothetical protein